MNDADKQHDRRTLVDEREALNVYLQALLRDVPEADEAPPVEAPPAPVAPPVETPAPVVQEAPPAEPEPEPAPVPEWGRETFQALLFKVAGLTLAVPLVELSGVREWEADQVTAMPGHSPSYLGLVQYRERSVPVVDTARLVLPEDRLALLSDPLERLARIVFIEDGAWGLACDEVDEVLTLQPDQVRWRSSRTRRRWLAGTVIDHMCAIIDPPVFADMLATGIEDEPGADEADG